METVLFLPLHRFLVLACLIGLGGGALAAPRFKHIIVVVQENRTPDNLFGSNPRFEPGVDLATQGRTSRGKIVTLSAVPLTGCYDLGHSHAAFERALTLGADQVPVGALAGCKLPPNPQFTFLDNSSGTVQPYFDIATNYGFANAMFQTNQGESFPAHQFLFGGTSSPSTESPNFVAENRLYPHQGTGCTAPDTQRVAIITPQGVELNPGIYPCFTRPTMAEVLDGANLSWTYYAPISNSIWTAPNAISQICQAVTASGTKKCNGAVWKDHVVPDNPAQILTDIMGCKLSTVSWVIPTAANSDHAVINDGTGPAWVANIIDTLGNQNACGTDKEVYWKDTAILITWDDWGGWFDHVKPFSVVSQPRWGASYTYGFRVPLLVVSAYTPHGVVSNMTYDFGSLLYFIEQNFGLGFIGPGDTIYSHYADEQAAARGPLSDFFTLISPRAFVPIATALKPDYFLAQPPSLTGPDDD